MPGSPRFICQPEVCTAYCCHAYSVSLGDAEVARFRHFEGLEPVEFLELDEDSKPIMLPMAEPYLLARQDNHCKMLSPELGCSAYHGRPNACRLYPHFVVFWDTVEHRAVTIPTDETAAAFDWARDGHAPASRANRCQRKTGEISSNRPTNYSTSRPQIGPLRDNRSPLRWKPRHVKPL
jgi:Fe-S-cluster containining protein